MSRVIYSVYPRYTPGSPAQVDPEAALRIARSEREAYEDALSLSPADPLRKKAQSSGLAGIVVATWEVGRKAYRRDVLTGKITFRMLRARAYPNGVTFYESKGDQE